MIRFQKYNTLLEQFKIENVKRSTINLTLQYTRKTCSNTTILRSVRFNESFKLIQIYIQRDGEPRPIPATYIAASSSVYTAWVWIYRSTGDADKRDNSLSLSSG